MRKLFYITLMIFSALITTRIILISIGDRAELVTVFVSGLIIGLCFVALKLNLKNAKLNSYKRELEKESITADENSSKVKVLEQKIEVLEKALENALKKND